MTYAISFKYTVNTANVCMFTYFMENKFLNHAGIVKLLNVIYSKLLEHVNDALGCLHGVLTCLIPSLFYTRAHIGVT